MSLALDSVDDLLVAALVEAFQSVAVSWHALKLACLMVRADSLLGLT